MTREAGMEAAEAAAHLPPEKQQEVLEYARWMRDHDVPAAIGDPARTAAAAQACGLGALAARIGRGGALERVMLALDCAQRASIGDYVRALAAVPKTTPAALRKLVGSIPREDLRIMREALDEQDRPTAPEGDPLARVPC